MKHNIVIPLSPCFGKMGDCTELKFALRGFDTYLLGAFDITIVGPKIPGWLCNARHIEQTTGRLKTALVLAADAYPEGFSWWYDDFVLIKEQTVEQIKVCPAKSRSSGSETSWMKKLALIRKRLRSMGHPDLDYSTPHGPYWFNKLMIDEAFRDWPGMKGKFPVETWILNKFRAPHQTSDVVAQYYGAFSGPPHGEKLFMHWCDAGMTPELVAWLNEKFPHPSRYEK